MPAASEQVAALRVGASLPDALTRSHLSDGRVVGWYGEAGHVIDAELDRPVPPALAATYGTGDFWGRWTRAECAAKAADVPIAVWLRRHGLDPMPGFDSWTVLLEDPGSAGIWVSWARARQDVGAGS